ncbi:MAG: copper homeostasis protein CutC [Marinilabiliaceae bacterium]|nr:copper homeostasis protein CutC [Marinilabiliaceae bacterium]
MKIYPIPQISESPDGFSPQSFKLEICAFSLTGAIDAQQAGADRIELCAGAAEGGTTPDFALIKTANHKLSIPVFPIIRPRGGNFCYNQSEFEMMKLSVLECKKLGCKGVTFSILLNDLTVDADRTSQLVELAYPMESTFIRGFDLTPDPFEALEVIKQTGCKRILTSGQKEKAHDAILLLKQLVENAGEEIIIMPGSGINPENLKQLIEETVAKEFHASARKIVPNLNPFIDQFGFGNLIDCDIEKVKNMKLCFDF